MFKKNFILVPVAMLNLTHFPGFPSRCFCFSMLVITVVIAISGMEWA